MAVSKDWLWFQAQMKPMINASWLLRILKLRSITWSQLMIQLKLASKQKLLSFLPYPTRINGDGMLKQSSQRLTEHYNHALARLYWTKTMLRALIKPNMLNGKLQLETTAIHLLLSLSCNVSTMRWMLLRILWLILVTTRLKYRSSSTVKIRHNSTLLLQLWIQL